MAKGPYYTEGKYRFKITDQGFAETPKQTPYFFLRGTPVAQLHDNGEDSCKEYEREIVMYLTDKAVDYTVQNLRRLGWEGSSFKELDPTIAGGLTWIGQVVDAECAHETNEKGTWEKWNLPYTPSDKPPKAKSDTKIASKLDAMFGKTLKQTAKAPAKAEKTKQAASSARDDGDVPF